MRSKSGWTSPMVEHGRRKNVKPQAVKADFHAALDRLIAGRPSAKELRAKAAIGKLKINSTNLAIEAGRSAALLWRESYADVKERMDSLKSPRRIPDVPPTIGAIRELRIACGEQIKDAKQLWLETTELHAKIEMQQVQLERYRQDIDRLSKDIHGVRADNAKLIGKIDGKNVTEFPRAKKQRPEEKGSR